MRHLTPLLTVVFLASFVSLASAQTRVLYDGFENGKVSAQWTGGAPCPVTAKAPDGLPPFAGNGQAACNWNGDASTQGGCQHTMELAKDPFPASAQFFVRERVRVDANMDYKAGSKMGRIGFNSAGEVIWTAQMDQGLGATLWVGVGGGNSFWGNNLSIIGDKKWHQLEFYVRPGTSGLVRVWVDDVQVFETTGNIQTGKNLYIHSNWSCNPGWEHDATNTELIDEVEIFSDATTGEPATGSMADGTVRVGSGGGGGTPPVNCAGTWSQWETTQIGVCTNGTRTNTESHTFTVTTPPSNGGAACPVSPETRQVVVTCDSTQDQHKMIMDSLARIEAELDYPYAQCVVTALPTPTTFTIRCPADFVRPTNGSVVNVRKPK